MGNTINFIAMSLTLPLILSVLYSRYPKKYKLHYGFTKAVWYIGYAAVVTFDYLVHNVEQSVAGLAVTIAIMEGVPLILIPLFSVVYGKEKGAGE